MMTTMTAGTSAASGAVVLVTCTILALFFSSGQVNNMKKTNEPIMAQSNPNKPAEKSDAPVDINKNAEKEFSKIKNIQEEPNSGSWWGAQAEKEERTDQVLSVPVKSSGFIPTNLNDALAIVRQIPTLQDISEGVFEVPQNNFSIAQMGLKILVVVFVMLELLLLKDKVQTLEEKTSRESMIDKQMFEMEKEKFTSQKTRLHHDLEATQKKIDQYTLDSKKLQEELSGLEAAPSRSSKAPSTTDSKDIGD